MRSRAVQVNEALMRSAENRRMELALPDGQRVIIQRTSEEQAPGGFVWQGHLAGQPQSHVILSMVGSSVSGTIITQEGSLYRLQPTGPGEHAMQQLNPAAFPEDEPRQLANPLQREVESMLPKAQGDVSVLADTGSTIDVMVVYTVAARDANGGATGIQSLINQAISQTNTTYANSGITPRLRLVRSAQVTYTETGDVSTDLGRLRSTTDGFMDDVHTQRNTYKADLVSLLVKNGGSFCGIAYLMTTVSTSFAPNGFSVVDTDCATGNLTFAHELGHNMGARHDWYVDSTNNSPYTYNHGHYNTTARFRTVMSYNDACAAAGVTCTRIPYWSNPNVFYNGYATGVSNTNNRATLNNTAYTIANLRPSI